MPPDPLPWKRVRSGEKRDYHVLRVGEDVFADPRDGEERARVIIDADDWCNVLPLTRNGNVVLVKQFRFGSGAVSLELPGGIVEGNEDAAATAARELEEETGYRAGRVIALGTYNPNPAHFTNRVHAFVAVDCAPVHDGHPDASEDLRVEVVPRARVKELATAGAIDHALILATIGLAAAKGYL